MIPIKGATVTLSKYEMKIADYIGRARQASNIADGRGTAHFVSRENENAQHTSTDTDVLGFAAEMAFGKLANLYPDFTIRPRSARRGEDAGCDFTLDGRIVDVKRTATHRKPPFSTRLMTPVYVMDKNHKLVRDADGNPIRRTSVADYFALMCEDAPSFRFAGFFERRRLMLDGRVKDFNMGPTYTAYERELKEWMELEVP